MHQVGQCVVQQSCRWDYFLEGSYTGQGSSAGILAGLCFFPDCTRLLRRGKGDLGFMP
jgi:hypothetical protein